MTCERCEREVFGSACQCGWKPTLAPGIAAYIVLQCSRQGCSSAIRYRVGYQESVPVCKWCAAGVDYNTRKAIAKQGAA